MSVVEIRRRRPEDGAIEVLARVEALGPGGPAVVTVRNGAARSMVDSVLVAGVVGPDGQMLHVEDGEAFVRALPQAIRGSRFWAARVD